MNVKIILFLLAAFLLIIPSYAATYYVSPQGDDALPGTSAATAWRTIDRVNAGTFLPGDHLLFQGGEIFAGGIWLRGATKGTAAQPIVVSSYGVGKATIASGTSFGLYAYNTAGIEVRHLAFQGAGRLTNTNSGVIFYLDAANTNLQYVRLDSLEVSGYQQTGISVGSWNGASGYTDVRITNCRIYANGEVGLASYAQSLAAHHNWYVGNCKAYDNTGRADITNTHTGNGIVLSGVDGALIEHCEAYHNGWLNANQSGGPVGIWGWCCNNLVIQNCESHHNQSGTAHDGGGFDLDGGCTNSVLQYNYSHDNDGPGYLLAQYPNAPAMHDVTVRYNISENDARAHDQGALQVWSSGANGGIQRAVFHNNTVLLSPPADGSQPKAVFILSAGFSNLSFRNNVFQTTGGLVVLNTVAATGLRLESNCYWGSDWPLLLQWKDVTYNALTTWRAATGQEQLADGRATGLNAAPRLRTSTQLASSAPKFSPLPESPVRGAGLDLRSEFNINPGQYDFVGNPAPQSPERGNIGALEAQVTGSSLLPVVLTLFDAERQGANGLLRWTTASEKNNAYFIIERSLDGVSFDSLAQVLGHGTSTQAQHYQFADLNVARYASKTVYYRLRQVDVNGTSVYSPIRVLVGNTNKKPNRGSLQLWPNPAANTARVLAQGSEGVLVLVLDARGQLVAQAVVEENGIATLPINQLAAGLYVVQCGSMTTRLVLTN